MTIADLLARLLFVLYSLWPHEHKGPLKELFKEDFMIGAALNAKQFTEEDKESLGLIKEQFNTISPENVLKWESVHPKKEIYDFGMSDKYVEFGEKNTMFIIGHTLVWHSQTPAWVFEDGQGHVVDRETLLERMRDHIHTIVGRYKGRIKGWDVVNEALDEDGTLRQSPWLKIIGPDYLDKAFEFAHEADPDAELYYNDYNLESEAKRDGAIKLIQRLQTHHIPVTAIGIQGHSNLTWPSTEQLEKSIVAFSKLGIQVNITELDIDVLSGSSDPYPQGLSESVQLALAQRYVSFFRVYLRHKDVIKRITFWGVTDKDSWLNYWPIEGRTNYPLLFDRNAQPKQAYQMVTRVKS